MDIRYTAGLFDGDGCVWIARQSSRVAKNPTYPYYFQLQISIVNTNKEVIERLYREYGGYISKQDWKGYKKNHENKWKVQYSWRSASSKAVNFLEKILPFLIIKKDRVGLALEFQKTKSMKKTMKVFDRYKNGKIKSSSGRVKSKEQYDLELECYRKMRVFNKRGK